MQRPDLEAGAEAAREAAHRASEHVRGIESGPVLDAERELLDHLAAIKKAVAEGVGQAPNLRALRNVLAELFERVQLIQGGDLSPLSDYEGDGQSHDVRDLPQMGDGLSLLPILRGSSVDDEWEPVRRELPEMERKP